METEKPLSPREDRKQTDKSLVRERGKTDESFGDSRKSAEGATDQVVKRNRSDADKIRIRQRRDADHARDDQDGTTNLANRNSKIDSERILSSQRECEDTAIENARSDMDTALVRERGARERQVNDLFSQERKATDSNLLFERTQTDLNVKHSEGLLTAERSAHLGTKTALTTREELLAIVSHDLRNPIGVIATSAKMLADGANWDTLTDEVKQWIRLAIRNADISLRLIRDILDMEGFSEGKLQLEMATHRLNDIIKESVENYAQMAIEIGVGLTISPGNISRYVTCDRDRIAQVLSNLIGNALKFTSKGGSILVKIEETESFIKVSVSDTGQGIPENQKGRIFERFTQLHNKDRRGIGLGLHISKTLVEAHHGKIWVESVQGKGSTFFFTLPNL